MDKRTSRRFRSLVISLAAVLTIIDLTHGFTLRHPKYQDLYSEESVNLEVEHDVKRSNNTETTENTNVVVPLNKAEENRTIAVNASVIITYPNVTERLVDVPTETTVSTSVQDEKMDDEPTTASLDGFQVTTYIPENGLLKTENQTETTDTNNSTRNIVNNDNQTEHSTQLKNVTSTIDALNIINATSKSVVTENTSTASIVTESYASMPSSATNENLTPSITTESGTTPMEPVSEIVSSTVATLDSTKPNSPKTPFPWKKYSIITRKRVANGTDSKTTPGKRIADSINSHTTESRVTLEKAFNLAPDILSLQELKNNLMESTSMTQAQEYMESTISTDSSTESMVSFPDGLSEAEEGFPSFTSSSTNGNQIEMVSKRAGYLNLTSTTPETQKVSRVTLLDSDANSYKVDLENDGVEKKTSQSQLADEAIKEELLKESIHIDEAVNTLAHQTLDTLISPKQGESVDIINLKQSPAQSLTVLEQKVEDELSVKPIGTDKKNSLLYTVNPNYKPLKKIEILPPKTFTRDPDDNSWRNESLTSLGIVFNAKNSSKAFTEVLKNKTETVMNNLPDQNRTIEKIELRERLEKIAEKRKSKKKKTDQFGNVEYTDYEENNDSRSSKGMPMDLNPLSPSMASKILETTTDISSPTSFPYTNTPEYYDSAEDDDYSNVPKIDIKKTTATTRARPIPVTQVVRLDVPIPDKTFPERKPTIQYFPPRSRPPSDVSFNEYNERLAKINLYNINVPPLPPLGYTTTQKTESPMEHETYATKVNFRSEINNYTPNGNENRAPVVEHVEYRPVDNVYLTQPPILVVQNPYDKPDNVKGDYIIRHYKDFLDKAIKDSDYDRNAYLYTDAPITGVTANDVPKATVKSGEYDYEQRKELLDRFVSNFNQNHERFKVDFPVLFNTSIVHKQGPDTGKALASSSAMFKRLYNDATASKVNGFLYNNKAYDPSCENITVELSPAYELHYYVPDQEEREVQTKVTLPHLYT